jgi:peptide chain release factor subunit 1
MTTWGAKEGVKSANIVDDSVDPAIEKWKLRRLIRQLESFRGGGTSMISLIIPPKGDLNRSNKQLTEELGTASSIKSHVNRLSVLGAISSTQQRLKTYSRTPPNGLVVFCGEVTTDDGKPKKLTISFEPFKPVSTSMYWCDNRFHCEALAELLEDDEKFGFLLMDGNGALYGTLAGSHREVLHKFSVTLPNKHGRGGQSALRFARLRLEKRNNYVRKVSEIATQCFVTDSKPNIKGLVLAGSAEFKTELVTSGLWDPRLDAILIRPILDIAYGGETGFNQAIELSSGTLKNVKVIQEKKLITKFLNEVAQDSGKLCFGVRDTMQALEMSAVETLVVWENLDLHRVHIRNPHTGADKFEFVTSEGAQQDQLYREPGSGAELTLVESTPFVEWIVENYRTFGTTLEFVTDLSHEGNQFCKGFGGIGGLLRYHVDFEVFADPDIPDTESDDDFM